MVFVSKKRPWDTNYSPVGKRCETGPKNLRHGRTNQYLASASRRLKRTGLGLKVLGSETFALQFGTLNNYFYEGSFSY